MATSEDSDDEAVEDAVDAAMPAALAEDEEASRVDAVSAFGAAMSYVTPIMLTVPGKQTWVRGGGRGREGRM
jgi:hypothetical protein